MSIIFSVGPIKGQRYKNIGHGCRTVLQTELARDADRPEQELARVRVSARRDEFYGGEGSKDYLGPVLHNPTWRQIKAEAVRAARATGDTHHQFLEGVHITDRVYEDGSTIVELWMGS